MGAFGNYIVPLQIGAPDMAFPKLNAASYWAYFVGGVIMLTSFFMPEGAARSGWTSYPPLSIFETGQTAWLIGMVFLITSSLLGSMNMIVTIVQLRAPGLSWFRLPFFVWAQFVTAFLLVLAFPPLEAAAVLQLMDRVAHTSFFLPSGLVYSGDVSYTHLRAHETSLHLVFRLLLEKKNINTFSNTNFRQSIQLLSIGTLLCNLIIIVFFLFFFISF